MVIACLAVCVLCILTVLVAFCWCMRGIAQERQAWQEEREQLLNRIMSASLTEYKAQERADERPRARPKRKDEALKRLEREEWA